ncbi:hypothetical protein MTR67_003702 [Solanum verrucosum]|uniref:F-box associated beta-propeller type 3 domain-containing protein n=1 Tax=Solanum verrucosum TaxID=315347 RepID=A0AAF0PT01_SOLVR|nr:hypothetical protein MTR67_003702 [Solanum verrucosum]
MYGLGYNVVSDDYKVVALSYYCYNQFRIATCVDINSVRKGLWEKLENSPYDHSHTDSVSGVLVNGALHWLTHRIPEYSSAIVGFNLSVDKFSEVPGPTDLQDYCFMCKLAALKGYLCISTILSPSMDKIIFWIMKEYGVKESWTKFEIKDPNLNVCLGKLLCSIGDDDDVLLDVNEELVIYNMTENWCKDLLLDVNHISYEGRTFVDSLVSPYFGRETEGYDVVSDDFKVVALSEGKSVTCVYIYSVRKGLWEKLENSPYDHSLSDHASGVLVNGALHWL